MTPIRQLSFIALFLCFDFSAQASSYSSSTAGNVPIQPAPPFSATAMLTMTTSFSGEGFSGLLRSAYADGIIFYQLVNNPGSTIAIGGIGYSGNEGEAQPGCCMVYGNVPYVTQTNEAFNFFTAGQDKASLVSTYENISGGGQFATNYRQTINFMGGPVWTGGMSRPETVYGEVLPGVIPGTTSYVQMVHGYYAMGKVDIGGQEIDAFIPNVPEPESYAVLLAGLGLIGAMLRCRETQVA